MQKVITSLQNPLVRQILQLQERSRERKREQLMVIEGVREIILAMKAGYPLTVLFHCETILPDADFFRLFPQNQLPCDVVRITSEVFNRLAYRKDNGGVIACARAVSRGLSDLDLPAPPLILVLDSVEKPGNLGAIIRTADAGGVSAVICCDPLTDLFNPNTIRASLGALFTRQVVAASSSEAVAWLKGNGVRIFAAALTGAVCHHEADLKGPVALILGSEAFGLSDTWLSAADQCIRIPMQGYVDSLNVSASAAILVFEAMRQRGFTCTSRRTVSEQENL